MPQLIFFDTEFSSLDLVNPDLISIGLVTESGEEFYAELPSTEWRRTASSFVIQNIVPLLQGGVYEMPYNTLSAKLIAWIRKHGEAQLVTDAPEYDFDLIRPLLEKDWPTNLIRTPIRFNSGTVGVQNWDLYFKTRNGYFNQERPMHHALVDAKALREAWWALTSSPA